MKQLVKIINKKEEGNMLKFFTDNSENQEKYQKKYSDIFLVNVNDLKEHPANTEFFNEPTLEEVKELEKSLKKLGQINPVIINKNNEILAGHQRWKVIKNNLKWDSIYVRRFYGTPEEEIQILIDDNLVRRNIKIEYLAGIEKKKLKYYSKRAIINLENFSSKVRNILLPHLDKISIDFLAHLASLPTAEQTLIVDQLLFILDLKKDKTDKEISKADFEVVKHISEDEKYKESAEKLRDLNIKLGQKDEIINQLKKIINQKEKEINLLKDKSIKLEQKIKTAENDNGKVESLQEQLEELKNQIQEKENEIVKTKSEYDILKKQYKELTEKKDEIVNKELKEAKEEFNKVFNELKQKEEKYIKIIKEKDERIKELEEKIKSQHKKENMELNFKQTIIQKYFTIFDMLIEETPVALGSLSIIHRQDKDIELVKFLFNKLTEGILMLTSQILQLSDLTKIVNGELENFKNEMKNIIN